MTANDPTATDAPREWRETDDDTCPDCLPQSECGSCADDRRFHEDLDRRAEERR